MTQLIERDFNADPAVLAEVRAAVREACAAAACSDGCRDELVLAVNEACMNIIQHGYAFAAGQQFRLHIARMDDMLVVHLLDNGRVAGLADLKPRELDDLRPGGLGVRFMREVCDSVDYLAPPTGFTNLLQLKKRIE